MSNNKISIIMGVYNCADTVIDSINSILGQTYKEWNFIICDDASTDNTYDILLSFEEKYPDKFLILRNKKNSGLAYSLNKCLRYTTGYYVARMDGDDISRPDRLEKQIQFLYENKEIDLVGSAMQRFNGDKLNDVVYREESPDKYSMKSGAPFNHATILTYKRVYQKLGGYTVSALTSRAEDHELWFRFFYAGFKGKNMGEPLYFVREDRNAIRRRTVKSRYDAYKITIRGFKLLNYPITWYIAATLKFIFKISVPFKFQEYYRNFQAIRFNKRIIGN